MEAHYVDVESKIVTSREGRGIKFSNFVNYVVGIKCCPVFMVLEVIYILHYSDVEFKIVTLNNCVAGGGGQSGLGPFPCDFVK